MSASIHSPHDGNHQVGIMTEDGYVIAKFQHPINFLKMEPGNAFEIAGGLMNAAFEARHGCPPPAGLVQAMQGEVVEKLSKQKRDMLVNRMVLMLTQIKRRNINWQAQQIVDTILAEIL